MHQDQEGLNKRPETCSNLSLHQLIESFVLDVSDSDGETGPHTSQAVHDDEAWWSDIDAAMQADDAAGGFFADGPSIANLQVDLHQATCHCGKLPHLCTCEYYRRQREIESQSGIRQLDDVSVDDPEVVLMSVKRRRITGKQSSQSG